MIMRYPSGHEVRPGDFIWFEEGVATGYVDQIFHNAEPAVTGYDEPSVFINLFRPDTGHSLLIGYQCACFEDEGVDLVDDENRKSIARAKNVIARELIWDVELTAAFHRPDARSPSASPFIIACYNNNHTPKRCFRVSAADDHYEEVPITLIPGYAWPVRGGGSVG